MENQNIIVLYAPSPTIDINSILKAAKNYQSQAVIIISDKHWFDVEYDFSPDNTINIPYIVARNFENIIFPDYTIVGVIRESVNREELMVDLDMPNNLVHYEHPSKAVYLFYENLPTDVGDNLDDMIFIPSNNLLPYDAAINTVLYDIESKLDKEYEKQFELA